MVPPPLVAFCRYLSVVITFSRAIIRDMDITNKYIPREYLALKINYCKKQLAELPEVKVYSHMVNGLESKRYIVGKHRYESNSTTGQKLSHIFALRKDTERSLNLFETLWNNCFQGMPPSSIIPHKVIRTLSVDYNKRVVMDKNFFDNLVNDSNTKYPKHSGYYFDGISYRSASERDIAILYTELGIPFKYEPSVSLAGLTYPINTDFVLYIKELDTCKFHEHFGMKDSSDYLRVTKIKYGNYTNAGLIPDLDILFTHDTEEIPFDIRYLLTKLNSSIYGSLLCSR